MKPRSLRARLLVLWCLSVLSAAAVGVLLLQSYRQSSIDQAARAEAITAHACDEITGRYRFYAAGWTTPPADLHDPALTRDLGAVVAVALARLPGVEGGIWQGDAGSLAYAFPTYEGTGPKTDLPAAEESTIRTANAEALAAERPVAIAQPGRSTTLILRACPLPGPILGASAWAMTRAHTGEGAGYTRLLLGLSVLLASILASAAWLSHLLLTWSRALGRIEAAMARHQGLDLPQLQPTGERELDRIVVALNAANANIATLRAEADSLSRRVADSERLSALGRVAAGIAHEIRNPIGAMRLKAENALAADDARRQAALRMILGQIARLDSLLRGLLTLTHRSAPQLQSVALRPFLEETASLHRDMAVRQGVGLTVDSPEAPAEFDPDQVRRALDNLLLNALQNAPPGGHIRLAGRTGADTLVLTVADDGPGLSADMQQHLFEPFATGRADGTGLGLSIVKEIADAHGGHAAYRPGNPGAVFELVLPCQLSSS